MIMDPRHLRSRFVRKHELVAEAIRVAKIIGLDIAESDFNKVTLDQLRQAFINRTINKLLWSITETKKKPPQKQAHRTIQDQAERGREIVKHGKGYTM